jgi:hypothetical protein
MTSALKVDPSLIKGWLTARSLARDLPVPVDDYGGWRVDTAQPEEAARYVFAEVTDGLRQIAQSTMSPLVILKLCGSASMMQTAVPSRWRVGEDGCFMTLDGETERSSIVPSGYELDVCMEGSVIVARIFARDGSIAASGYAASAEGVFVYDRIVTEEPHRRQGLASAIMMALGSRRSPVDTRQALVATRAGRTLYTKLGWVVRSPWATGAIPAG